MTNTRSAVDALLAMVAALAWGFAVFAFGARLVSPMVSGLAGLAFVLSAAAMVLSMHLRDRSLLTLTKGACPRCGKAISFEHRHRRWEPQSAVWAAPSSEWDCGRCGYAHSEPWACPRCPS